MLKLADAITRPSSPIFPVSYRLKFATTDEITPAEDVSPGAKKVKVQGAKECPEVQLAWLTTLTKDMEVPRRECCFNCEAVQGNAPAVE